MKQKILNQLRNLAHIIGGFVFLYWGANFVNPNDFPLWQAIVGSIFIGALAGSGIGFVWEGFMFMAFKEKDDTKDIIRTGIGGVIGGLTGMFLKDITFISYYMLGACIILIFLDIIRAARNYKKLKK